MSRILIIGGGVVGHATGSGFTKHGHTVRFFDIDESCTTKLKTEGFVVLNTSELFYYPSDFIFICVPTPYKAKRSDLSALTTAVSTLCELLKNWNTKPVVVIRSTVPVGTTEKITNDIKNELTDVPFFGVCINPEYLRERNSLDDFLHPKHIIIGSEDVDSAQRLKELYATFNVPITVCGTREVETHKYLHNIVNATKISFFNEARVACKKIGVDSEIIFPLVVATAEAIWNQHYGTLDQGPFAGNCLPKDTRSFVQYMKENHHTDMPLMEAVLEVNDKYPHVNTTTH